MYFFHKSQSYIHSKCTNKPVDKNRKKGCVIYQAVKFSKVKKCKKKPSITRKNQELKNLKM